MFTLHQVEGSPRSTVKGGNTQCTKFSHLNLATLGDFVDFIEGKKLHEMSFMGYGNTWKGCRDFITQTFLQLRKENKVSATDDEGDMLKDNITKVHHKNSGNHDKLVDCGSFLNYASIYPDEIEGAYEGEEVGAQPVEAATSDV